MRISTKGRYALRVMIDLARNRKEGFVKLQELSARQQISEKYLEGILGTLVRGKLLEGARGKGGGYRLNVDPEDCSVWQILSLMETSVAPVSCLDDEVNKCPRAKSCVTLPVWKELDTMIRDYLEAANIIMQLGFEPQNEVSSRRQELVLGKGTKLFLDKVDGMAGFYAKIEAELDEEDKVEEVRNELLMTFEQLGQDPSTVIAGTYSEQM